MPDVLDMYGMLDDPWLGYRYRRQISPSPEPLPPQQEVFRYQDGQPVPIEVAGRFAELKRNISEAEAQQLRDLGYSGAFTRNSMGTTAQSVVYDPFAVKRFGDWFR